MSENSKIEWCDHTSKARDAGIRMRHPVAVLAERFTVAHIEASLRAISKRLDMVRFEIAAAVVTAMHTNEFVSAHDIESPLPTFRRRAKVFSLLRFAVDVTVAFVAARRVLACPLTYQCPRRRAVLLSKPITRSSLHSRAHLGAALSGHL
ncbi:hypothetical protein [Burkholderia sp. Se-20373]|uniref:hypothetical protein n=1 Tax=Burkholderia sp. Se-20373 TaxID=2703898 RepID=UPI001F11CB5B|nr:hypothetical protein [Burkholderia sp. Se-20373]